MPQLPLVFSQRYQAAISRQHRFPMGKYGAVHEAVQRRSWARDAAFFTAEPVTASQAALAHDPAYVDRLSSGALSAAEVRAIGLPQNPSVAARAFASAGGTLTACRLALKAGLAASLAGGSHHANRTGGRGFCVMNDVGIALSVLLNSGNDLNSALVLDLDVHQGDGTAEIFKEEPRVFTASLHCEDNYPFDKAHSDLDVGLAKETSDSGYLPALDAMLHRLDSVAVRSDLIVFNAGVDPHQDDRLGRLALSDDGLAARDDMVFEWVRAHRKPLCLVLGGGYDRDIGRIAERHAKVFDRLYQAHTRR
ncbi:MAG: histone deacetylase [Alphaproteobacteria bacterium]